MGVYTVNMVVVYIFSLIARVRTGRPKLLPTLVVLTSLIIVAGLRSNVGTDFQTYYNYFSARIPNLPLSDFKDVGFAFMCKALALLSHDPQIMFFVSAVITNMCFTLTLRVHAQPFELGMFLYISSYLFYSSFNGIRQFIAVGITFAASRALFNGRIYAYFAAVLLASFFHVSAVILLPIYFLVRSLSPKKSVLVTLIFLSFIMFFFEQSMVLLFDLIEPTSYVMYMDQILLSDNGTNQLFLVVNMIPVLLSLLFYPRIRELYPQNTDIILNMSIFNVALWLLAIKHVLFGRVALYFIPYNLILVPRLATIFDKRINRLVYYSVLVCYLLYNILMLMRNHSHVLPFAWYFSG